MSRIYRSRLIPVPSPAPALDPEPAPEPEPPPEPHRSPPPAPHSTAPSGQPGPSPTPGGPDRPTLDHSAFFDDEVRADAGAGAGEICHRRYGARPLPRNARKHRTLQKRIEALREEVLAAATEEAAA